jgi:ParB family chromosome partitioning protein
MRPRLLDLFCCAGGAGMGYGRAGFEVVGVDIAPQPNYPFEFHQGDALEFLEERGHEFDAIHASPPCQGMSIQANGLIQPLIVQQIPGRPGYRIVAGHRRLAAVQRLGWAKAPCVVRRDMLPDAELLAMLVENGQRAGLDPIEEARALNRLVDGGMTVADVSKQIGRPLSFVRGRLLLLSLPLAEQEEVRAGHYTLTHARTLLRDAREAERRRENPVARPVGRPKGATTRPHFGDTHPLAGAVRAHCDHRQGTPKVGGVGCGPCWEAVIREDALAGQAVAS